MPSKSKSQKNYMTLVYLYKKGKLDTSKYSADFVEKIKNTADGMKMKSVKDFAKTKTKNLSKHVKNENSISNFQEFFTENVDNLFNFEQFLKEELTLEVDLEFNIDDIFNKQYTYAEYVLNHLINILCDVNKISEKDFKKVDETVDFANKLMKNNEDIDEIIEEFEKDNKRYQYCAERIYWKFLVKDTVNDDTELD